jgi:hypothetical protein
LLGSYLSLLPLPPFASRCSNRAVTVPLATVPVISALRHDLVPRSSWRNDCAVGALDRRCAGMWSVVVCMFAVLSFPHKDALRLITASLSFLVSCHATGAVGSARSPQAGNTQTAGIARVRQRCVSALPLVPVSSCSRRVCSSSWQSPTVTTWRSLNRAFVRSLFSFQSHSLGACAGSLCFGVRLWLAPRD